MKATIKAFRLQYKACSRTQCRVVFLTRYFYFPPNYKIFAKGPQNWWVFKWLHKILMRSNFGIVKFSLLWFVHWYLCVSVCPSPRTIITSGMICCDIGRVWLAKQVWRPFPAFNYFIWHLLLIKWMGVTQHVVNACQRKLRWCSTSYKRSTGKMECFIYKSEWANA